MSKQTVVEWLHENIAQITDWDLLYLFEEALEKEKEQIQEAYANGANDRFHNRLNDYYNETYGN